MVLCYRGPQKKSGCWENAKRETGWTYWQCKDVFKQAPSSGLRFGSLSDCVDQLKHQRAETPLRFRKINNHAVLDQFHEIKSNDEVGAVVKSAHGAFRIDVVVCRPISFW